MKTTLEARTGIDNCWKIAPNGLNSLADQCGHELCKNRCGRGVEGNFKTFAHRVADDCKQVAAAVPPGGRPAPTPSPILDPNDPFGGGGSASTHHIQILPLP